MAQTINPYNAIINQSATTYLNWTTTNWVYENNTKPSSQTGEMWKCARTKTLQQKNNDVLNIDGIVIEHFSTRPLHNPDRITINQDIYLIYQLDVNNNQNYYPRINTDTNSQINYYEVNETNTTLLEGLLDSNDLTEQQLSLINQTMNYNGTQDYATLLSSMNLIDDIESLLQNSNITTGQEAVEEYLYNNYIDEGTIEQKLYYIERLSIAYNGNFWEQAEQLNNLFPFESFKYAPTMTEINYSWTINVNDSGTGEIIDIPGLLFTILGMPFAFISQAFNLTIFPGTVYAVDLSHIFLALIGAGILIFIIKKFLR